MFGLVIVPVPETETYSQLVLAQARRPYWQNKYLFIQVQHGYLSYCQKRP